MGTKVTCYNLRHPPKDNKTIYLEGELDSTIIRIPITQLINRMTNRWGDQTVINLGAAMPKEIEVVETPDGIAISRDAFREWWDLSKIILQGGVLREHHKEVFGNEFANAWWFMCTPRCYADPCPITSTAMAQSYIKDKLAVSNAEALRDLPYDVWRAGSAETLKVGDHYINAYSFSRKPVMDPDIALALACNTFIDIDIEHDDIDKKYGLIYK